METHGRQHMEDITWAQKPEGWVQEARLCYRVTLRELFCHLPREMAYDKDLLSGGGGG